ncbi:MAG: c-type cytochrome [Opitutus sp.]|nr:c-type cytochrome [Opitutus sp.]
MTHGRISLSRHVISPMGGRPVPRGLGVPPQSGRCPTGQMRPPCFRKLPCSLLAWALGVAALGAVTQGAVAEDSAERAKLPLIQIIPAAAAAELTPANGKPDAAAMRSWVVSHGDAGSRRYSALDQINRSNVSQLREAWTYHAKDGAANIQANPIVVDGVMFAPTPGRAIVAVDAGSGIELWRFTLEAPARIGLDDAPARRGLVFWPGDARHGPRIVFASGKWVYALEPKSGRPVVSFGENGRTPLPTGGTAVGVIWKGTYVVPGLTGDLYAFNLGTGALIWRFHTIPKAGEFGADTWRGPTRDGAHPWGGVALDEDRGIVYLAVGAARPDFIGVGRHGDNLYSDCLVAINARTGNRLWHFQNIRHDIWDLDNPAPPNLATITREGRRVDVVACVTKTGATLLLDRVTGQTVFPFRLRRAPVSTLPGEVTAPYQPDPELPQPFSSPEFKLSEVTDRTPAAHDFVLAQVQRASFGWFEPPSEGRPLLYHSSRGGAEWTGACIDVPTGRLYVSTNNLLSIATVLASDELERDPSAPPSEGEKIFQQTCAGCHGPAREGVGMVPTLVGLRHRTTDDEVIALLKNGRSPMPPAPPMSLEQQGFLLDFLMRRNQPPPRRRSRTQAGPDYIAVAYRFIKDAEGYPGTKPPWGLLNCIDLNTGRILWRVPLGEYPELTLQGVPKTGTENFGGPTVTAGGLVFCAGTADEKIRAFDKDTGEELWSAKLPRGGYAPPTVYQAGGTQYVVIAATGGGKVGTATGDAYVAFALPDR